MLAPPVVDMALGGHRYGSYQGLPIGKPPDEFAPLKYIRDLPSLGQVVCVYCEHDKHPLVQRAAKFLRSASTILKSGTVQTRNMWDGRGMSLLESELWAYAGPLARAYCQKLNISIDARWVVLPRTPLGLSPPWELAAPSNSKKGRACLQSLVVPLIVS